MKPKIILDNELNYLKGFGKFRRRNMHVENTSDVEIVHFGKPLILKNKDEYWSFDLTRVGTDYQKSLVKFSPTVEDFSTQPNTFYSAPRALSNYADLMDYVLETRDVEDILQKLDVTFSLVTRHSLPEHAVIVSLGRERAENLYKLRLHLSKIGLGYPFPFTRLIKEAERNSIITDISDEAYEEEYEILKEYFQDETELYLDRDLLENEDFEDDEFLLDLFELMDKTQIESFIFYR